MTLRTMSDLPSKDPMVARLRKAGRSMMRIKCCLLSCAGSPFCERCGTDLYDPDYIQIGKLDSLFRLRTIGPKRCDHCGKKYVKGYDEYLCSEECHDNWLPF